MRGIRGHPVPIVEADGIRSACKRAGDGEGRFLVASRRSGGRITCIHKLSACVMQVLRVSIGGWVGAGKTPSASAAAARRRAAAARLPVRERFQKLSPLAPRCFVREALYFYPNSLPYSNH